MLYYPSGNYSHVTLSVAIHSEVANIIYTQLASSERQSSQPPFSGSSVNIMAATDFHCITVWHFIRGYNVY